MSSHRLVKFAQMCLPAHTHFSVVETNCLNSLNMNHLQVSGWLIFVFGGCCCFGVLFSVRMSWLRYSLPAWFLLSPGILSKGTACTCWWLCKRARLCGLRLVIHPLPGLGELGAESMQENERKCQMFDETFATLMVKKQAINNKQKNRGGTYLTKYPDLFWVLRQWDNRKGDQWNETRKPRNRTTYGWSRGM